MRRLHRLLLSLMFVDCQSSDANGPAAKADAWKPSADDAGAETRGDGPAPQANSGDPVPTPIADGGFPAEDGLAPALPDMSNIFKEFNVFESGKEGYNTYRIPAIIKAGNGDLLAFCEGRSSKSDFGDLDIVLKRSADGGKTWSSLSVVAENGALLAGNPGPVLDTLDVKHPNRIWLVYNIASHAEAAIKAGEGVREVLTKYSDDHGQSWSAARNITSSVHRPNAPEVNPAYASAEDWRWYAITPGHCVQLKVGAYAGRLLCPANHTRGASSPGYSHAIYSDDHGATWQLGGDTAPGNNEGIAAELSSGEVMINMRNATGTSRSVGYSSNGGQTWFNVARDPELIEPRCQGSLLSFAKDGRSHLLFANPASDSTRTNGTVRLSYDEGDTWEISRPVYSGGFAYSDLVAEDTGLIGLLFEKDAYAKINYAHFALDWLTRGRDRIGKAGFATFVQAGVLESAVSYGGDWAPGAGFLTQKGVETFLWGGELLPAGDFVVTAVIALGELNDTAASIQFGDHTFAFDGGGKRLFTEGGDWARTIHDPASSHISPEMPFTFKAIRTGTSLSFMLNDATITTRPVRTGALSVGLRPWRNTLRVYDFGSAAR
jgi:sialidase-1